MPGRASDTEKGGGTTRRLRRSSRRARASRAAATAPPRRPSRWRGTARASGSGRRQGTPTASRGGSAPPRASGCGAPPGRPVAGWPGRTAPRATRPSRARGGRRPTAARTLAADAPRTARPATSELAPRRPRIVARRLAKSVGAAIASDNFVCWTVLPWVLRKIHVTRGRGVRSGFKRRGHRGPLNHSYSLFARRTRAQRNAIDLAVHL